MVVEIMRHVDDWQTLTHLIEEHPSDEWIFRGVTDMRRHKLIPSIGRDGARKDPKSGDPLPFDADFEREMV